MKNEFEFENSGCFVKGSLGSVHEDVVITFGHLQAIYKKGMNPWGYDFLRKNGYSVVSFSSKNYNWYRGRDVYKLVSDVAVKLVKYKVKIGYASSMGGYGLGAFADLLEIDRLLLMNPISTLNANKAPWEMRFTKARKELDWEGDFHDGVSFSGDGYIVYDPMFEPDRKHADRYPSKIKKLKAPYLQHGIPYHLSQMNMLKGLFATFAKKNDVESYFYSNITNRRYIGKYYKSILGESNSHLTAKRKEVILKFLDSNISNSELLREEILGVTAHVKKEEVDLLRDVALLLESTNLKKAYQLMCLASRLRPNGEFIASKLKFYENIMDQNL